MEILSAVVSVIPPAKGVQPNTNAITSGGTGYTAGAVAWKDSDGTAHTSGVFAGNTAYAASVTLTANPGYVFASSLAAAINGDAATVVSDKSAGSVTLTLAFAETADKAVTGVEIVDQPSKLAYYHGEELDPDLAGLTLNVTYDDGSPDNGVTAAQLGNLISTVPPRGQKLHRTSHNNKPIAITVGGWPAVNTNNLTITAKELYVSRVRHTKVYDTTNAASTNDFTEIWFTGREFTDDVFVSSVTGTYTNNTAGTQTMTIGGGNLGGTDASNNYRLVANNYTVPVIGGITQAPVPTVAWPTTLTANYGTGSTLSSIPLPASGTATGISVGGAPGASLTGTFSWPTSAATTNVGDAGPRTHQMIFTPGTTGMNANYRATTGDVSITVQNKPVTVTVETPSGTLSPLDTSVTFTVTVNGLVSGHSVNVNIPTNNTYGLSLTAGNTGIINNAARTITMTYNGTAEVDSTNPSLALTMTQAGNNYYTPPASLTVTPTIYDGQAADRAIPVTQNNINEFNTYARTTDGLTRHYKLTQDVTLTAPAAGESNWTPIGASGGTNNANNFRGSFDGQKFTITNLTINATTSGRGLFGYTNGATISNVGLRNVNISGGSYVGGVVGQMNGGTVQNCFVTGSVTGTSMMVGGVAGQATTVQNCYSTAAVTGDGPVGGVAGYVTSLIKFCYSTGAVRCNEIGRASCRERVWNCV
jgi:hypothetical protein